MIEYVLDEICFMQSGGTPKRSNPSFYNGDIPWITISDFKNSVNGVIYETEEYITQDGLAAIGNRVFKKGTLLLAMYGSIGKTAITGDDMSINQAILGISPKNPDQLNIRFLKYWLEYNKPLIESQGQGATLNNISLTIVKRQKINLPDLETQNKIVAILDKANSLIEKRERTIELYDELLRMKFLELFGDPIFNEKKWNLVPMRKVISHIDAGWSPESEDIPRSNSNQKAILKLSAISKRKFDESQNKLLPPGMKIKKDVQARKGDLLFSRKNTKELVGATVYIFDDYTNLLLPDTIFNLRYNQSMVSGIYLYYLLNDYNFRKSIQQLSSGAALSMSNISQEKLLSHKIPLPDYRLQMAFEEIVQSVYYKFLKKQENFRDNSFDLLNSVSQLAFKGELTFNTAVDLEVLLENDYEFFKANSTPQTIQLLLDRLDKNEGNDKKIYEEETYQKAKDFVFGLLQEGKIKQEFDTKKATVKLSLA